MKGSIFLFLPSRPFFLILRGLPSPPDFLSSLDPSYAEGFTEARDGDSGKAEVHQLVIGEVFTSLEILGTSPRMTMFKTYSRHPRSYAEGPRQPEDVDRRQKVPMHVLGTDQREEQVHEKCELGKKRREVS